MYLVSEDYLKDLQSKSPSLEPTPLTVAPVQIEPSFPPPPPVVQPSTSTPPPPIPESQTKSSTQNVEMSEEKDPLTEDLESWAPPPNSEPHTLIDSIKDDNDVEVKSDTPSSNNKNEGEADIISNKKTKVKSPPITKSMQISNIRQKKSICTICNAEFDSKKKLMVHIQTRHKGKKAFPCRICKNKTFESESDLNKHIKQVHFSNQVWTSKKEINPIAKTLAQKRKRMANDVRDVEGKLETAVKKVKEDVKSQDTSNLIKCKECNKIFESFKEFKQHQLSVHSGQQRKRKAIEDQWFDQNGRKIQPKKVNLM